MSGKIYFVGAGPGDPELLTRKAWKILSSAEVLLHDALVPAEIVQLAPAGAIVCAVGKRCGQQSITQDAIHALLIGHASAGWNVVRLQGGDPLIFGRAGEEMAALRKAGIDFEIVPGVTAASAAAAAAQISLTDRRFASRVIFLSAHRRKGARPDRGSDTATLARTASCETKPAEIVSAEAMLAGAVSGEIPPGEMPDATAWGADLRDATLAIYMPGSSYARVARLLSAAGLAPDTPCVVVSQATTPVQTICRANLATLSSEPALPSPALLIVGKVAGEVAGEVAGGVARKVGGQVAAGDPNPAPADRLTTSATLEAAAKSK